MEIYFFDTITIGGSSTAGLAVVAAYDVKDERRYDSRIYRWDGTGCSAEGKLMRIFRKVQTTLLRTRLRNRKNLRQQPQTVTII